MNKVDVTYNFCTLTDEEYQVYLNEHRSDPCTDYGSCETCPYLSSDMGGECK